MSVGLVLLAGCRCDTRLSQVSDCSNSPELCPPELEAPDAGPVVVPPPLTCPNPGAVTGRICATDQRTWVNGATVSIEATDCQGKAVHVETMSAADGSFTLVQLPPGTWTVHAVSGAFVQDSQVTVSSEATFVVPDNQLCVAQRQVRIAVVTAAGDKIEDLLASLQLTYTTYDGASFDSGAGAFLADLGQLKKFDLVFIDCAAAKSGSSIDFGPKAALIKANLKAYVAGGGSLYASDWALLFATEARPGAFDFLTNSGAAVANPLPTATLMGYAPQTVNATIADPGLAAFLGKASVPISFPRQSGASSLHWGLMQNVDPAATVLVSAASVDTCATTACSSVGNKAMGIPLAARIKVTAADQPGGQVVYTSFHNIGQSGDDVARILKYLILHL